MTGLAVARILHVVAIVIWIGGVAFVTAVILPAAAQSANPEDGAHLFELVERRFSRIARGAILIAGLSGLYMVIGFDVWDRFSGPAFWWMHAMVALWSLFALLLFVAEPLWLHRRFAERMRREPQKAFRSLSRAHWILLLLSLITTGAAIAGVHG